MLVDDVTIRIKAGDGGKGAVAFQKAKFAIGPTGASGGNGGNVYAKGVANLNALQRFRFKKELWAQDGENGGGQFRDGHTGKDILLEFPVGTVIHNLTNESEQSITKIGERILLAKGGKGGKGNFHFRAPWNTSPKESEPGKPGEEFELRLELKLIADVGFIGLPNAGKSSLLNALTNAKSKVGNYAFTTLEPHLGAYYELILADIPGLIEGSSRGKGLGIKFLRHIERTKILFHLISAESENLKKDYETIRNELGNFNKALLEKREYLFLTKIDLLPEDEVKEKLAILKKLKLTAEPRTTPRDGAGARVNPDVLGISMEIPETITKVKEILNKIKDEKVTQ